MTNTTTILENGCWRWDGPIDNGYALAHPARGMRVKAHRWVYDMKWGLVEGLVVHHTCGNRRCINPDHLTQITSSEHGVLHGTLVDRCHRGHDLTVENAWRTDEKSGKRRCRLCDNICCQEKYERSRDQILARRRARKVAAQGLNA